MCNIQVTEIICLYSNSAFLLLITEQLGRMKLCIIYIMEAVYVTVSNRSDICEQFQCGQIWV
jgi:hypothetical protein